MTSKIDWDRICLTSPVGPYAEPVALCSPVEFGGGPAPRLLLRRSHLHSYRVVEWPGGPQNTKTYAVIAEFAPGIWSSTSHVQLSKFVTMPSLEESLISEGRIFYAGWGWTPEFFDAASRFQRRVMTRSVEILNDTDNPGWAALRELVLCDLVPFATRLPTRQYVSLLLATLDRMLAFWARILRLKWYLGRGLCSAMLDPSHIEYPRFHSVTLEQIERVVGDFGSPLIVAATFASSLRCLDIKSRLLAARHRGLLALSVEMDSSEWRDVLDVRAPGFGSHEIPRVLGPLTDLVSPDAPVAEIEDGLPMSIADFDDDTKSWLTEYGTEVVGTTIDERKGKFALNFPDAGTLTTLDSMAQLPTLRYLRSSDFPSEQDWLSFLLCEAFEHEFGAEALTLDLSRYVLNAMSKLASEDQITIPFDPTLLDIASCHIMKDEIEKSLQEIVVSILKHRFGSVDDAWFFDGAPSVVQDRVTPKWEGERGVLPREYYFDLRDYQDILKENWPLFQGLFAHEGEKPPGANKALSFISSLNHVRLPLAHASRRPPTWLQSSDGLKAKENLVKWLSHVQQLRKRCEEFLASNRASTD